MKPDPFEVRFPYRGRSLETAPGEQLPLTTRVTANMRTRDAKNGGALRGSQRPGMSKHATDQVVSGKPVRRVLPVQYDSTAQQFTDLGTTPASEWARAAPADARVRNLVETRLGDVVALSGDSQVFKINPDGVEVWKFAPTLPAAGGELLPLDVDALGNVFVATGSGAGNVGRLYAYEDVDELPALLWQIDLEGHAADIHELDGRLYVLTNDNINRKSMLIAYDDIRISTTPTKSWEVAVPWPASQVKALPTGQPVVASKSAPDGRGVEGDQAFCQVKTVDWRATLDTVPGTSTRTLLGVTALNQGILWSHFDAAGAPFAGASDGAPVTFWPDISGGDRHLGLIAGTARFRKFSLCGQPGVEFDSVAGAAFQSFAAAQNEFSFGNRSSLPFFDDYGFFLTMLVRPIDNTTVMGLAGINDRETVFQMSVNSGVGQIRNDLVGPSTGTNPQQVAYDQANNIAIITLFWAGDDVASGFMRVNGTQSGAFQNNRDRGSGLFRLGNDYQTTPNFKGVVHEAFTFFSPVLGGASTAGEAFEGYLAHRWGVQGSLPSGHAYETNPPERSPSTPTIIVPSDERKLLTSKSGVTTVYDPGTGELLHGITGAGMGEGLAIDSNGDVITTGQAVSGTRIYQLDRCESSTTRYSSDTQFASLVGKVVVLSDGFRYAITEFFGDTTPLTIETGLTITDDNSGAGYDSCALAQTWYLITGCAPCPDYYTAQELVTHSGSATTVSTLAAYASAEGAGTGGYVEFTADPSGTPVTGERGGITEYTGSRSGLSLTEVEITLNNSGGSPDGLGYASCGGFPA